VQVRLGTQNGSKVVQAAVTGLYTLVLILTALKALPLSCAVSRLLESKQPRNISDTKLFVCESVTSWLLRIVTNFCVDSLISRMQIFAVLTLPIGKLVLDFVKNNHSVRFCFPLLLVLVFFTGKRELGFGEWASESPN
jgi:hypothetical protein